MDHRPTYQSAFVANEEKQLFHKDAFNASSLVLQVLRTIYLALRIVYFRQQIPFMPNI